MGWPRYGRTEWCLTLCVEADGSVGFRPYGCPCAENCAAVRGCHAWKPGHLRDRVCNLHLDKSEVLGLVCLFGKLVLDTGPGLLGCIISALCGLLNVAVICSIHFDGVVTNS